MNSYLFVIIVVVVIGSFFVMQWSNKIDVKCPECGSKDCKEISREQVKLGHYERFSGGMGGTEVMVKVDDEITFRCGNCSHTFKKTISRSR